MSAPSPFDASTRRVERPSTAAVLTGAVERLSAASDTPRLEAEVLLAFAARWPRSSLLAFPERAIEPAIAARFAALVAQRVGGAPVAYLTGVREFFSLTLSVDPAVLIPRPETELLVEVALARCESLTRPRVLDIGAGSGAVALAIKHVLPEAEVTGADISAAALAVARSNGEQLVLTVRWVESEWFAAFAGESFDVIVSNPPYVRSADVRGALEAEPRLALDGGADGLDGYRVLFAEAPKYLNPGGALLVEHGADQRPDLVALATQQGWRVAAARDDLAGHPRILELEPSAAP